MSSRRSRYELIAECTSEWSSRYIFIHKKYKFNVYLCDKTNTKTKRIKKPRTNPPNNNNKLNTNTVTSQTYSINVLCLDNESKPLQNTEHSIIPSNTINNLTVDTFHRFTVSINKLSMNHGDSPFHLLFTCDNNDIDCSIANNKFISVRVINYKFRIISKPQQLINDEYKFYKDVKPKTNFLCYDIALYDSNNKQCKPPRKVPIKCIIYFENGIESPNQKALNLKGINTIYNEPYTLSNDNGCVTVPLRIEETSTKYENKKFIVKFIADYEKITSNLDIAPVTSEPFLVRTKINKYRIKNKEQKKKPGRKKKNSHKYSANENIATTPNVSPNASPHIKPKKEKRKKHTHKIKNFKKSPQSHPQPPPPLLPFNVPSYIMPPLFATAPGMHMTQIDCTKEDHNNHHNIPPLPPLNINHTNGLSLPSLTYNKNKKNTRKRNIAQTGIDNSNELLPNKRQKVINNGRRPTTRSMTRNNNNNNNNRDRYPSRSPTVSADSENCVCDNKLNNVMKYGFTEHTSDKILEPMIIECLSVLGESMGRREYFVSGGSECHCYLKCLFCGSTAYPPKERHVKHIKTCMLWNIYQNMTRCVSPHLLAQAFDFNPSPLDNSMPNINNSMSPHMPPSVNNDMNSSLSPYVRRNSSGNYSLIRSDRCNSFNGLIGPYNSLLLAHTPTPIINGIHNSNSNINGTDTRSRSGSFPVSFTNPTQTPIPPLFQMSENGSLNGVMNNNLNHNSIGYASFPGTNSNDIYGRSHSNASSQLNGLLTGFPLNLLSGSNLSLNSNTDINIKTDIKNMDNASNTASQSQSDQSSVKTQKI